MSTLLTKLKNISSDKKILFKNFTAMGIIQLLNYVMPFITLPYLSRVLTVDKFGLIFFAQAIMDYFSRFVAFGYNQSGVRDIATNRSDPQKISEIFTSVLFARLALLLVSFIIFSIFVLGFEKFRQDWVVYFFTFIALVCDVIGSTWFFQGIEKMKFITYLNIFARILSLVCIFIFVRKASDYYLVPLFYSLGGIASGVASFILIKTKFKVKTYIPKIKEVFASLKHSSQYFIGNVSIALYQSANAFVLGLCISTTMVAYYVSAQKIYLAIYFTIHSIMHFSLICQKIKI